MLTCCKVSALTPVFEHGYGFHGNSMFAFYFLNYLFFPLRPQSWGSSKKCSADEWIRMKNKQEQEEEQARTELLTKETLKTQLTFTNINEYRAPNPPVRTPLGTAHNFVPFRGASRPPQTFLSSSLHHSWANQTSAHVYMQAAFITPGTPIPVAMTTASLGCI